MANVKKISEEDIRIDQIDDLKKDFIMIPRNELHSGKDILEIINKVFDETHGVNGLKDIKADIKFLISDYLEGFGNIGLIEDGIRGDIMLKSSS